MRRPARMPTPGRRIRRRPPAALGVLVLLLALGLSACRSDGGGPDAAPAASSTASPTSPAPESSSGSRGTESPQAMGVADVAVTPGDAATDVRPTTPVTVRPESGTLSGVTVTAGGAQPLGGSMGTDGVWRSKGRLRPDTTYTVEVEASDENGRAATARSTFTTLTPDVTATYGINYTGHTVGVGMPVSIQFDSPVTSAKFRADVERLVSVSTSPRTEGAWGWLDHRQLMWRPRHFWKPGTRVTVTAPLTGVQTGPGKWVANDDRGGFTVGERMVSTVDIHSHTMTVRRNGDVVRRIPVSTGRPGPKTETRSGTKVVIRKEGKVVMDSTTVGIPRSSKSYYKITTRWNLRVTWTGEYLHSAPWSVGSQGSTNVSHGCTNMAPANAKWMFTHSRVGDVVRFTGSSRQFRPTDGIGVWVYDWPGWRARSALAHQGSPRSPGR